jgi:DNA helicase-2/ATP-dependent DNA helicase PcrA
MFSPGQDLREEPASALDEGEHDVTASDPLAAILEPLNDAQRRAASASDRPLLIIAGASTGKTQTLVHRVAALIARGADPRRILLLTFSRRAAQEMTRRATRLLDRRSRSGAALPWAGTFHAIANRLLRHHASAISLDPAFTQLDREDSADLLDRLRHEIDLARTDRRFPRKGSYLRQVQYGVTDVQMEFPVPVSTAG